MNTTGAPRVRSAASGDVEAVLALWRTAATAPTVSDRPQALAGLLAEDPGALLVAELDGELIGTLIAAWDGWRGSFYRLAVHPGHRRRGVATLLVREGERRLLERGALRLDAVVASDEAGAPGFWTAAGYTLQRDRGRYVRNP